MFLFKNNKKPAHHPGVIRIDVLVWFVFLCNVIFLNALYYNGNFEESSGVEDTTISILQGPFSTHIYPFPDVKSSFVKPVSLNMYTLDRPSLGIAIDYKYPELGRVIIAYVELLDLQGKVIYADELKYEDPRNHSTEGNKDVYRINSITSRYFRFRAPPQNINQIKVTFSLMK